MRTIRVLAATLVLVAFAVALGAQEQEKTPQQQLDEVLALLDRRVPRMTPEEKENVPAYKAILTRYYLDRLSLLQSEKAIAEALIKDLKTATRGGGKATPSVDDILANAFGAKPSGGAAPPSAGGGGTAPAKKYVPGVSSKPSFHGSVARVAGKEIGVVEMTVDGKKAKIVEIPAALPGYPVSRRASLIAERLTELQAKDKLWWASLTVGTVGTQTVIRAPKSPSGTILTADAEWAAAWGVDRTQLANMVIKNIRTSLDDLAQRPRGESPADRRLAAAKLRMDGDALFDSNAAEAEAKYLAAIAKDSAYALPYHRLADLYMGQGQPDKAKEILQKALESPGLSAADKAEIQKRLGDM